MTFSGKVVAVLLAGALLGSAGCSSTREADPVLLKIKLLDETLVTLNDKSSKAADYKLKSIQRSVERNQLAPPDAEVLRQSAAIRAETQGLITYLRGIRQQLIVKTGNLQEFERLDQKQEVAAVLGEPAGGAEIQTRLNAYSTYIRQFLPSAPALAPAAKDELRLGKLSRKQLRDVSFVDFYFEDAPLVTVLAALSQKEAEVLKLEAEALERQSWKVGSPFGSLFRPGAHQALAFRRKDQPALPARG